MTTECINSEVIGDTRHDYGGFPKSLEVGSIIDMREYDYEGSESLVAYVVVGEVTDIMEYLAHLKPKTQIPAHVGRSNLPKYAQWYKLDIDKLKTDRLVEKREYFEFSAK